MQQILTHLLHLDLKLGAVVMQKKILTAKKPDTDDTWRIDPNKFC